ncbi:MAG: kynureninase [Pseudonocardiaceae bacterium]|nr:kynureninase [Pseudonocardiaceae bacterium]
MRTVRIETRAQATQRDETDELAPVRERYALPDGVIYLDGNSLGALPAAAPARLAHVVSHEWGQRLIRSWDEAEWFTAPARVAGRIARLIGAGPDEVAVADSTSVNLFKLLVAACRLRPDRPVIVMHRHDFPTDVYIGRSVAELLGRRLRLLDGQDPVAALDRDTALLALSEVDFRTGARRDVHAVTRAAHDVGALALWDLSHSAGALDVDLAGATADMAVGCGYKYLAGGPGAPAFAMVARRHHEGLQTPLPGWMGHADPFAMSPEHVPGPGVAQLAAGTPPVLSLLALEEGVATFEGVAPGVLRQKGSALTQLFIELVDARCSGHGLRLVSPREASRRGSQVSVRHPAAYPLVQALIRRGVIGDFREPDIARFGFAPAYLRFADVWDAVEHLRAVLAAAEHADPELPRRGTVT